MTRLLLYLTEILFPKNQIQYPGRWVKKKNVRYWFENQYPEPGYQNKMKEEWIKNLKK